MSSRQARDRVYATRVAGRRHARGVAGPRMTGRRMAGPRMASLHAGGGSIKTGPPMWRCSIGRHAGDGREGQHRQDRDAQALRRGRTLSFDAVVEQGPQAGT